MTAKSTHRGKKRFILAVVLVCFFLTGKAFSYEIDACLECHQDRNLVRVDEETGEVFSQFVDRQGFLNSTHGRMYYNCIMCHTEATPEEHPAEGYPEVSCAECHQEIQDAFEKSTHGMLDPAIAADIPRCYDCHTRHDIMFVDEPESSVHKDNIAATCGACHGEQAAPPLVSFLASRIKGHGKESSGCTHSTQNCMDCHFDAVNHGQKQEKTALCMSCHAEGRPEALLGTVHRSGFLGSPLLLSVIIIFWIAAVVGVFFFIKASLGNNKKNRET